MYVRRGSGVALICWYVGKPEQMDRFDEKNISLLDRYAGYLHTTRTIVLAVCEQMNDIDK